MKLIETVTVGSGGTSQVVFSSIPQTGTDLLVKVSARQEVDTAEVSIVLNGDFTTGNYSSVVLQGNGSSVSTSPFNAYVPLTNTSNSYTANTFSNGSAYVSNYTSSTSKSISVDSVTENNATTAEFARIAATLYTTSNPITVLSVIFQFANDLAEGTSVSLYSITAGSDGTTTVS